jgi:hypothetical protein
LQDCAPRRALPKYAAKEGINQNLYHRWSKEFYFTRLRLTSEVVCTPREIGLNFWATIDFPQAFLRSADFDQWSALKSSPLRNCRGAANAEVIVLTSG